MSPGVTIRVMSGGTLNLKNMDVFMCMQLTQGIIVETEGSLDMEDCRNPDSRFGMEMYLRERYRLIKLPCQLAFMQVL